MEEEQEEEWGRERRNSEGRRRCQGGRVRTFPHLVHIPGDVSSRCIYETECKDGT